MHREARQTLRPPELCRRLCRELCRAAGSALRSCRAARSALPRMRTAKGTPHRLAARNLTALLVASLVLPCISLASVTAWQRLRLRVPGAPLAAAGGAGNMRAVAPVPAAAAAVPAAAAAVNGSAGGDADAVPRLLVPGAADAAFRRALETRKIILTGKTGGGIGNQMQDVLEQLELVTKFETLYVLPGSTPRSGGSPVPPEDVWNVDNLERQLEAAVFRRLPDVCSESAGGKFDVTFTRVDAVARDDVAGMEIVRSSLHTGKGVRVKFLRKGLEKVDDLRAVLTALLLKTPREVQRRDLRRRALCVYVDNHAAGSFWKFGQYMIPSEKYMRIARQWPLESMAVVHLRYEELDKRGCSAGPPPGKDSRHHVCVKPRSGVVRWVPHKVYAERVAKYLDANDIDTVYFTQPKYMEPAAWRNLADAVQRGTSLTVARSAKDGHQTEDELNFIERALAFGAKLFLSEYRSTWSRTMLSSRRNQTANFLTSALFDADDAKAPPVSSF